MPIKEDLIVVGGKYETPQKQQREVIEITKDEKSRDRINYKVLNKNLPNNFGPTKSNPPLRKTFAEDCSKIL